MPNKLPASETASSNKDQPSSAAHLATTPPVSSSSFGCPQCSRSFSRRENLARHLKTHDPDNTHRCSICGKPFARSDVRRRHEAIHEHENDTTHGPESGKQRGKRRKFKSTAASVDEGVSDDSGILGQQSKLNEIGSGIRGVTAEPFLQAPSHQNIGPQGATPELRNLYSDSTSVRHLNTNAAPAQDYHQHNNMVLLSYPSNYPYQQPTFQPPPSVESWNHVAQLPLDFSSLLAHDYNNNTMAEHWFNRDFYSAIRETGNDWANLMDHSSTAATSIAGNWVEDSHPRQTSSHHIYTQDNNSPPTQHGGNDRNNDPHPTGAVRGPGGLITRVESPPNEPSEVEGWPFAWNPKSQPVLHAKPIHFSADHPLYRAHDSRFNVSEASYLRLTAFLELRNHLGNTETFYTIPTLEVTNIFVGLFFKNYASQIPVLHIPTLDMDKDIAPPLLAIMVAIGSIYSFERHTRRFAIVLLDVIRRSMEISIENDFNIVKDSKIIYATLLACHTGLWCGNERAYLLAEAIRGAVVTYWRQKVEFSKGANNGRSSSIPGASLDSAWRTWVAEESDKRLCWAVYSLDCQFPGILYLPGSINKNEVIDMGCPCDDAFWYAPTARHWKNLLGPASEPPSCLFSAAIGPFLVPLTGLSTSQAHQNTTNEYRLQASSSMPPLRLNSWTAFLVLLLIQTQIYDFSQELIIARKTCGQNNAYENHYSEDEHQHSQSTADNIRVRLRGPIHTKDWEVWKRLTEHKRQLLASLTLWSDCYFHIPSARSQTSQNDGYFNDCGVYLSQLSLILIEVPVSDLQDAIGKSGVAAIPRGMDNLENWIRADPNRASQTALTAIKIINSLTPNSGSHGVDTGPYGIITFFLCHITLWAFVSIAKESQLAQLLNAIKCDEAIHTGPFFPIIQAALRPPSTSQFGEHRNNSTISVGSESFAHDGYRSRRKGEGPRLIFRSAAEVLTRLGIWGASLDLAMILSRRADM